MSSDFCLQLGSLRLNQQALEQSLPKCDKSTKRLLHRLLTLLQNLSRHRGRPTLSQMTTKFYAQQRLKTLLIENGCPSELLLSSFSRLRRHRMEKSPEFQVMKKQDAAAVPKSTVSTCTPPLSFSDTETSEEAEQAERELKMLEQRKMLENKVEEAPICYHTLRMQRHEEMLKQLARNKARAGLHKRVNGVGPRIKYAPHRLEYLVMKKRSIFSSDED